MHSHRRAGESYSPTARAVGTTQKIGPAACRCKRLPVFGRERGTPRVTIPGATRLAGCLLLREGCDVILVARP